ncbi:DegT/DnrJ/EryC1/StrS family aminotransferase [Candidatus Chloroploca sp. M-50]|uniref:DegT/DnrJ/EryC1/StrS family aminotransferase n=1 Tax=Candidatus Chloroploca mongolica TaxID=2528176 RepID=A0ABS4DB24_9CHLR|nr:DegT/DnrJ/EryC1/StrS family aminotransferase [Candidatus Chloroploca mongolica]MBP1466637.1 DegT/DnrJ/EryC1/StrS family aminotransferase [Candidatus Chloroploca mongolica]
MASAAVPFGDLKRQYEAMRPELDAAIAHTLASGWYILGEQVAAFEAEFAAYSGASHCVGVASGAEALYLALAALGIAPGDEVITVANACMYQVAAILQVGALPVLVEVDPATQNMSPAAFEAAITPATRAVIPVHLFGRMADMPAIMDIALGHDLVVVEDAAQAHGAFLLDDQGQPRRAGSWGHLACFSFYPSKNLGAIGDGGALTTEDFLLAEVLRRLRMYGWGKKYETVEAGGRNSRLDELQAAILRVKLRYLEHGNQARRERAAWYRQLLADLPLALPVDDPGMVYHLFVITLPDHAAREHLRQTLLAAGIGCDVHYPLPAHHHPAYAELYAGTVSLPVTEDLAGRILSLPMFPELTRAEIERVCAVVREGVAR